jgi:hypothetical protein
MQCFSASCHFLQMFPNIPKLCSSLRMGVIC